jgi:hypothetical protein
MFADGLLQVRRADDAIGTLQEVLAGVPDPEASWLLSRAYLQKGSLAEAARALEEGGAAYRAENPLKFEPSPYTGSAKCAECHRAIHRAELASRHATTFHRASDLPNLPLPRGRITDPDDPKLSHVMKRAGDKIEFESQSDGKVLRALAEYAFGSDDHYMSLVGRDDQGVDRILRLSYYVHGSDHGWDRTTGHSAQPARSDHILGKPLDGPGGIYRCLFCHTTTARSVLERSGPEAADHAIGCERCHGPGENHLIAMRAKFADHAIVNPALASAEAITKQLCGQCHSLHEAATTSPSTDPYFLRYESTGLAWSRCYTESQGGMSCVTCHDPHRNSVTSTDFYEAKCLTCHKAGTSRSTCPVDSKQGCLGCHMPATEVKILHMSFTDHYIRVRK